MSVELLGGRLLGEVQEQAFDELLQEIKEIANPRPSSQLGILPLDNLVDVFRHPQRQATPQRSSWTTPGGVLDDEEIQDQQPSPVKRAEGQIISTTKSKAPFIEVTSSHSASGKTNLLYLLTSNSVVPKAYGGSNTTMIWLDTDGRFSPLRLTQVIEHSLRSHQPKVTDRECNLLVQEAISHIHVFQPQSSAQLISTLKSIPEYLLSPTQHASQSRQLGILILDSATAFHWPDRSEAELQRLSNPSSTTSSNTRKSKASTMISLLKSLQQTFDCTVLFTTDQSLHPKPSQQQEPAFVSPWTSFATLSLHLSRTTVPQFALGMSVDECLRDQPKRTEAITQGRFRANVHLAGSEGSGIVHALSRSESGNDFVFRITEKGVELE